MVAQIAAHLHIQTSHQYPLNLQELEKVGGREELDRMVKEHNLATSPRK
jgi:hypothetical protein